MLKKIQPTVAKVKRGITRKEQVASFLNKKTFLNSRVAFREFKTANPTVLVKQTYFYALFVSFGVRVKKGSSALTIMSTGGHKNCVTAYKTYTKNEATPISFGYFLTLWKRHFKVAGYIRRKPKVAKVVVLSKTVELSAKQIIAKGDKLLKAKVVKSATQLFKAAGCQVI
jgi:hypothetical protein